MAQIFDITIVNENPSKGLEFRALFYDKATEQFYGGSGATALDALSWCLDEYVQRAVLGRPHSMARNSTAPGASFGVEAKTSGREAKLAPTTDARIESTGAQFVDRPPTTGCFDQQITSARASTVAPSEGTKASSASRRSAAKKGKRQ